MKEEFIKLLQEKNITFSLNEPMSKHTSFKVGGVADIYIIANSIDEIQFVLKNAKTSCIPMCIIGNGTNILVKDNGIRGIVLKLNLTNIQIKQNGDEITVLVDSGVKLGTLSQKLLQQSITGFEFASGIPGTIGGAVRMNAGAHGKEMKDIVINTTYINKEDGNLYTINNSEHEFEYRNSIFGKKDYIILSSELKLCKGNKEKIKAQMDEYLKFRKENQPIEYPSGGSTFKRGVDFITAKLIDECGLKGYKIGGAEVSKKHAGFIINTGNATANNILDLVKFIKETVYEKTGKKIELEIEVIGE